MRKRSTKNATSFDVARRAHVSRATVSFVMNDIAAAKISETTKARVFKAARELGYVPDAAGKALVRRRTENIALVYTHSYHHIGHHSIFLRLMDGILEVVHQRNLRLIIDSIDERTDGTTLLRLARAKHIDGLILLEPRTDDEQLAVLAADLFPTVLIGSVPGIDLCSIDIDNVEAARQAVEHLIGQGHRRIGCITNAPLTFAAAKARLDGYRRALRAHGIRFDPPLVQAGYFSPESGSAAMESLLKLAAPPTAVFVASDTVALGALQAIRRRHLRVPDDIAVFGFDDIADSRYTEPPLSTVSFPVERHGQRSAEMLLALMEDATMAPFHETTPFELVVRDSSGRRVGRKRAGEKPSSSNWKKRNPEEVSA